MRKTIAIDGTESTEGRALFLISALYWCTKWLPQVALRFVDVGSEDVRLAVNVFAWEHSLPVEFGETDKHNAALHGAALYAAVAFRSPGHLRLTEARHANIPVLLALQFPEPEYLSPAILLRRPAAFDPRKLAADLERAVRLWSV